MEKTKPISDASSLNISLPMLIQAVGLIGAMVWGYGQLNTRISFLEYQVAINEEHLERIEEEAYENQDAEIPADIRQNQRIDYIEKELDRLERPVMTASESRVKRARATMKRLGNFWIQQTKENSRTSYKVTYSNGKRSGHW